MAVVTLDASLADIVKTLDWEKVPDKLHCAACQKFNLNAYKTTCCDSYICESCFNNALDLSCPTCDHKPFTTDVCKPNKAMRNTIKAYLKTVEKSKADERARAATTDGTPTQPPMIGVGLNQDVEENGVPGAPDHHSPADVAGPEDTSALEVQPSVEDPDPDLDPESADVLDDDVDIQVELEDDHQEIRVHKFDSTADVAGEQFATPFEQKPTPQDSSFNPDAMNGMDFSNMMNGFNNMDYNQMMQMMAANGMGSFNPMMGMPMGMNPMSAGMFGGLGATNGGMNGMNGMNMAMNFTPNQGMYSGWNGQNNNMWQNNNANAFPNGMGGDFGSNYGFNMASSGNVQQSYPGGDFQTGYYGRGFGRGRGRGRGGYGRGRGNFNQYPQYQQQGYHNGPNQQQQQHDSREMQIPNAGSHSNHSIANQGRDGDQHDGDTNHEDEEFAPGGQEEVQEALGDSYHRSAVDEKKAPENPTGAENHVPEDREGEQKDPIQGETAIDDPAPQTDAVSANAGEPEIAESPVDQGKPIPAAYNEDLQGPMPPPSAPLGPSAQYGSRGHGRFSSRGRGTVPVLNGHSASPVKPFTPAPPVEPKGVGVVGAPTGPRAMREPPAPARSASRSAGTGFKIMGRATMATPQISDSRDPDRARSKTPDHDHEADRERDQSRRRSRQDKYAGSRHDADEQEGSDYRDRDHRHRRSRADTRNDEGDGDDARHDREGSYSRPDSVDRRSSRRSRGDREKPSPLRHHSSRSRRYHDEATNDDHEMEDFDDSIRSHREGHDGDGRSKHRVSKSSRYDERERDRDRDREQEREHERDRDRDRERERDRDKERDREREERYRDRDRKRSRHDRHREDDKHHDYDYEHEHEHEADDQDSRHRSRRHKRDHRRDEEGGGSAALTNGRSHRSSAVGTPTPTPAPVAAPASTEAEKDPHTLEREARNRERMLKEQQRREKAAKSGASSSSAGGGGSARRVTYKYEDELERGLVEAERANARWR